MWQSNRLLKIFGIKMIDSGILCHCIGFVNFCFTLSFWSHVRHLHITFLPLQGDRVDFWISSIPNSKVLIRPTSSKQLLSLCSKQPVTGYPHGMQRQLEKSFLAESSDYFHLRWECDWHCEVLGNPMLADYREWDENKRFSIKLASCLIKNPLKDILTWTSYLVIH